MPAVRLSRRRRSSLAISLNPAKAGIYGVHTPSPRPVTFAPNVTPGTYEEPDSSSESSTPEPQSPTSKLFPPSEAPAPAPSRRRVPPGKRRSLGYIPRPPNAFMLFRADFVRQKHVPGSIETNHGSLSKIIGNCWRALPLEEKRVWEIKAKHAKAEHKVRYPNYRFRPVHNKNKEKKKEKPSSTLDDERRCEEVAQLLLEGKKGDELAAAVRDLDRMRSHTPATQYQPTPIYPPRRSSSVPLPNDYSFPTHHHNLNIALPSLPFFSSSRPASPVGSISRAQRMMLGQRRASSACPAAYRSWTMPVPSTLQRDDDPLPEVDTSLFEQAFFEGNNFTSPIAYPFQHAPYNVHELMTSLPQDQVLGPLDNIPPEYTSAASPSSASVSAYTTSAASSTQPLPELDPLTWLPLDATSSSAYTSQTISAPHSEPSTAYSGSPAHSEQSLPVLHAPQPQAAPHQANPTVFTDMWKDFSGAIDGSAYAVDPHSQGYQASTVSLGLDFCNQPVYHHQQQHHEQMAQVCDGNMQAFSGTGLDEIYGSAFTATGYSYDANDTLLA